MAKSFNLYELTQLLRTVFTSHPLVNDFLINKYRLNDTDHVNYAAAVFTVNGITRKDHVIGFDTNILYVDRLTDRRDNELAVQSVGASVIIECLNAIDSNTFIHIEENFVITPFSEQFADNTAGVFAKVKFNIPSYMGECDWLDPDCFECLNEF